MVGRAGRCPDRPPGDEPIAGFSPDFGEPCIAITMRPWLVVLALACLLLSACQLAHAPPDLLSVLDVQPGSIDVGDQVEVIGNGFPEGRPGTVTFRGRLHRPGRHPEHASFMFEVTSDSRNRIAFDVTEKIQQKFCGEGDEARHTTFRGEVLVAFSPQQAGAPPITGRLSDVVLDVTPPPVEPEARAALSAEGKRATEFLGFELTGHPRRPPKLARITPGSRSERAGLLAADRLLEFDGVVVHDLSDLVPAAGQRLVTVSVQRGRLEDPVVRVVDVDGFAPAAPRELAPAAMLVGFAVGVMLLFVAPVSRLVTWIERRVALRLRDTLNGRSRRPRTRLGWLAHAAGSLASERTLPASDNPLVRVVPALIFLAVCAGFTRVAFGLPVVGQDLDLPLALLVSTTALTAIGLVLGGWRGHRRWSLVLGLKSAVSLLLFQLPALGVFSVVVLTTGSSRAVDLVSGQGALPWEWHVFRNPLLLVGFAVLIAAAVPETSGASPELPETDEPRGAMRAAPNPGSRCLMFFAEWGHVFVLGGLAAVVLLGGWNVPGLGPTQQGDSLGWQIVGAALLQLKCWGVVLLVRGARWLLPRVSIEQMMGLFWRWLAPLTIVAVASTLGWTWGYADEFVFSLRHRASIVLFAVTVFLAAYLMARVLINLNAKSVQLNVNPWL